MRSADHQLWFSGSSIARTPRADNVRIVLQLLTEAQMKGMELPKEAKERAYIGNEIINRLYSDVELNETVSRLDEMINVLQIIKSKKDYDIEDAIEILRYAGSYAVNIKDWK